MSTVSTAQPERVTDTKPAPTGSETILVVEDHEALRELALETLTGLGYQVVLAADGEEALEQFRTHRDRLDLAVLDVVLPKLSGPEVYSRIHSQRPDLPVIFATGYSPDIVLLQKVQQQRLLVLQKPYSPRDLASRIREALDQRARVTTHD